MYTEWIKYREMCSEKKKERRLAMHVVYTRWMTTLKCLVVVLMAQHSLRHRPVNRHQSVIVTSAAGVWLIVTANTSMDPMLSMLMFVIVTANTSMDPMLSMLMANMAQVRHGSLVCDPFVGSGQSWVTITLTLFSCKYLCHIMAVQFCHSACAWVISWCTGPTLRHTHRHADGHR